MTTDHKPLDGEVERDAKDFAVEFGESMAKAAQRYMEVSAERIRDPDELSDTFRALGSAIHEFRKRAARARSTQKEAAEIPSLEEFAGIIYREGVPDISRLVEWSGLTAESKVPWLEMAGRIAAKAGLRIVKTPGQD